jgi:LysM repeat protein
MFARVALALALAAALWAGAVRPSSGAGQPQTYVVRPGDTLWSIASARYPGDPRDGVWRLERRNGLGSPTIRPGQRLRLP